MTSSLDMIRGRSNVVTLTNNSGGGLVAGDVCIQDATGDEYVTTTTSAASTSKIFIAAETIANGAAGKFYATGYCPLVTPSASVTRGRYLFTHTVAKQAAENATYGAGAFGVILKSGTTPSVWLFAATAQSVGAGTIGGSTGSTDNAIIRADGTGGATIQSSLAAVDDSGGINIPTGQTYNINGSPHTHALVTTLMFTIDGGGSAITTGVKGDLLIDFACTLNAWTLLADTSGAIKIDIWKDTYANYPPTDADSITNAHEPEIAASGTNAQDTDISDWADVTVDAGDILRFNVDSAATITRCLVALKVTR